MCVFMPACVYGPVNSSQTHGLIMIKFCIIIPIDPGCDRLRQKVFNI